MKTKVRWRISPPVNGCRWCGDPPDGHRPKRCLRLKYEAPTAIQYAARRHVRVTWGMLMYGRQEEIVFHE